MSMKIKPIKIIVVVYGSGVFIGLALAIAGIILKFHALMISGFVFFFAGCAIGSIPLVGSCLYLLWKKMRFVFKQKP